MGSRKKRSLNSQQKPTVGKDDLLNGISSLPIDELMSLQKSIPTLFYHKLEEGLRSKDLKELMKANLVLDQNKKDKKGDGMKSVFFDPNDVSDSGRGYKYNRNGLPFEVLRKMGNIFIIRSIVNTRVEQLQNFLQFSHDEQKEGFTIRKKKSLFDADGKDNALSKEEKKTVENIVQFLNKGGNNNKWDSFDNFQDFVRKIAFDSLTLDQLSFEILRNRIGELEKFRAIDASLIRLLDCTDPKMKDGFEQYRVNGFLPRYCMAWQGQILTNPSTQNHVVYYPWELGYGIRNKSSDICRNGYGVSELEILVELITYILNATQYNGNNFSKGSQPNGFLNIKDENIDNSTLNEFRQIWTQAVRGVSNSHRIPIFQGIDVEWIDLQKTNNEMEYDKWIQFLIVMVCSVYRIDPSELGFEFQSQSKVFGQDGQRERLYHSREKGLKPLLIFIQNILNHFLIEEIDERFEFAFTGVDVQNEDAQVKLDKEKVDSGFVSMEDMFEKYSGRKFDPEKDTILNSVYQTAASTKQQAEMYGGEGMNAIVEEGVPEENPYDKYEKSYGSNPILQKALEYVEKEFAKKD